MNGRSPKRATSPARGRAGEPLHVLAEQDFVGELRPCAIERVRAPAPQRLGPVEPGALAVPRVERAEQRVVVEPPPFFRDVRAERVGSARAAREVHVPEPGEAPAQRDVLQRPDLAVLNARGDTDGVEARAQPGLERLLAAGLHEVFDAIERDELRVDRHGAQRRVGRRLARRHLVDRQQLQDVDARGVEPADHRFDVANLADTPAPGRGNGEKRDQRPGAA